LRERGRDVPWGEKKQMKCVAGGREVVGRRSCWMTGGEGRTTGAGESERLRAGEKERMGGREERKEENGGKVGGSVGQLAPTIGFLTCGIVPRQ
jgi:hypothetical protein